MARYDFIFDIAIHMNFLILSFGELNFFTTITYCNYNNIILRQLWPQLFN